MKKKICMFTHPQPKILEPKLPFIHLVLNSKKIEIPNILIDTGFEGELALPMDLYHKASLENQEIKLIRVNYANNSGTLMQTMK